MYRKIPMWETRIGTRAIGDYSEAFAPKKKKKKEEEQSGRGRYMEKICNIFL